MVINGSNLFAVGVIIAWGSDATNVVSENIDISSEKTLFLYDVIGSKFK